MGIEERIEAVKKECAEIRNDFNDALSNKASRDICFDDSNYGYFAQDGVTISVHNLCGMLLDHAGLWVVKTPGGFELQPRPKKEEKD